MGRNHRYKKDLKAEKAKVKLKQPKTKFLPKGLNVTKTTFKIKPIVLNEQLKEKKSDVPLSKRKLNTKDLLSRTKHYNENVRHDACRELAEMITLHLEEIINQHLSEIILSVSSLMQDQEGKVRRAAVNVINTILENVPEAKLEPFFSYFSTNMCCAMTNIHKTIQEDSLLFLDCFLKYDSRLISQTSEKLLPNFFTLISKFRNDSNLERTLTVNLGSKLTSVTWRIKVLSRLHAILESILHTHILDEKNEEMDVYECYKNAEVSNTFPLYKDTFSRALDCPSFSFENSQNSFSGPDILNRHVITLVPLLYETWIEVVPEKKVGKGVTESTVLNEEASAILSCIMNTLYLLWKYVIKIENHSVNVKSVFLSAEGKKFLNHLLINFPYCQTQMKTKQDKTSDGLKILESNTDPKCARENLLICYMYCVLNINYLHNNLRIELEAVTTYITKCLSIKKYVDVSSVDILLEFLKTCLVENSKMWKRVGADLTSILENTIIFYRNVADDKCKQEIFNILLNIADLPNLKKSQQYKNWLCSLPNLLCQSKISDVLVEGLLTLSRKNNETFHKALLKKFPRILDNLDNLNIILTMKNLKNEDVVKRSIVNIFFFIPTLQFEQLEAISNFIDKHPCSKYAEHFIRMLKLRLEMKNYQHFENDLKKCSSWTSICNK